MPAKRKRVRRVALLPTALTLSNGICGFVAIIKIVEGAYEYAAWCIIIGMIFDAIDGKLARITGTASKFGTQLDSLCDVVTFGIAPAFLVNALARSGGLDLFPARFVLVISIFYMVCVILRLARFNVETPVDQGGNLECCGLTSPAAAGVISAGVISWASGFPLGLYLLKSIPISMLLLGLLMVSRLKYPNLINKLSLGTKPFVSLIEFVLSLILLALFHEFAFFLGFIAYALLGPARWIRAHLIGKVQEGIYQQEEEIL
jgi:CDP-diacylglycerol--serine O-phosphatidyltransferase